MSRNRFFLYSLLGGFAFVLVIRNAAFAEDGARTFEPGSPFTYLMDTGPAAPQSFEPFRDGDNLKRAENWIVLPEDELEHDFSGNPALLNDKITITIRRETGTISLEMGYGKGFGFPLAQIRPDWGIADEGVVEYAIKILENNPGAVEVELMLNTEGPEKGIRIRLTTGESKVELLPLGDLKSVFVERESTYIVIPDLLGDDMVFTPESYPRKQVLLPAEKFYLQADVFLKSLLMCVRESEGGDVVALVSDYDPKIFRNTNMACETGKRIWIAVLEFANWYGDKWNGEDSTQESLEPWKPPFSAKWRVNELLGNGFAKSHWHQEGDRNWEQYEQFFVYPIDRNRDTPLTRLVPIDIMRGTLGVGPCQYILEAEGLGTDDHATPNVVTEWIERLFKRNRAKRETGRIKEQTELMVQLLEQSRGRVDEYAALAEELGAKCTGGDWDAPELKDARAAIVSTIDFMKQAAEANRKAWEPETVSKDAEQIQSLIEKADALSECQGLCERIRSSGASNDHALSNCRMAARWLIQQCKMMAEDHKEYSGLFDSLRNQIEGHLHVSGHEK